VIGTARRDTDREFTEFASATTPRLFRSALLLSGDWQLAEDLVQTTLAKLFVAWGKVRRAESAQAYAHGTLTKTFLSYKRVRRNTETPTDTMAERAAGPSPAADSDSAADADLRLDLFAALDTLDKTDRAVVVLRYWEDRSVTETARQLGMSEAAIRTRASRAMAKLRETLAPSTGAST
jgi:RNA polymerase sigma-70 factor (sigma-E family)